MLTPSEAPESLRRSGRPEVPQSGSPGVSPFLHLDEQALAWITFDDPERRHNVLTEDVMRRFASLLTRVEEEARQGRLRALVVRSGKRGSFIVGADIGAIRSLESPEQGMQAARFGQHLFQVIERLPIPTVALIDGLCLGGGLELSLACARRVASDDPRTLLGFPEVLLGILPAWGGTTRLPRIVGLRRALELTLTGQRVTALKALEMGIVDELVPAGLPEEAIRAAALAAVKARRRRKGMLRHVLEGSPPARRLILASARRRVLARTRGHYPAPLRIIAVLASSSGNAVDQAMGFEAQALGELIVSPASKNLVHLLHLRQQARKPLGPEIDRPAESTEQLALIGAGTLGRAVAELAISAGIRVRLTDVDPGVVSLALGSVKGRLDREGRADQMRLLSGGTQLQGLETVDLLLEAVPESFQLKKSVLSEVEKLVPHDCALASSTSSLSVSEIGAALGRPERLCGMHFSSPLHKTSLVEVVRGSHTDERTLARAHRLAVRLGRVPIVVSDTPGFVLYRILAPYFNEAVHILQEGASITAIDEVALDFGMSMGPFRLMDEIGLDVVTHSLSSLHRAFGSRMEPPPPLRLLDLTGRGGRKGDRGFYRYERGRARGEDPALYRDLELSRPARGRGHSPEEISRRLSLALVNEAAKVMEDGVVASAGEVDLAMALGAGFPGFRGGVFRYADRLALPTIREQLTELAEEYGPRFEAFPLITRLAAEGRGFYAAFPGTESRA